MGKHKYFHFQFQFSLTSNNFKVENMSISNCTLYRTWCIMICLVIPILSLLLLVHFLSKLQFFLFTCILNINSGAVIMCIRMFLHHACAQEGWLDYNHRLGYSENTARAVKQSGKYIPLSLATVLIV